MENSRRTSVQNDKPFDSAAPQILVDAMLGNVARDLRLLGFDTAYAGGTSDAEVLGRCQRERRVLVTRDRQLARRAGELPHIFVAQGDRRCQTLEVLQALGGNAQPAPFSRCLECNEPLEELPLEVARSRVPDHVALTRQRFSSCPRCRRVFWAGSHSPRLWARIRRLTYALQAMSRPV